jgi:pantoate kinase
MARFGMPAELAYSEKFDVEIEVLGGGLGDAFNCWVLGLVIKKGEGNRDVEKYRCIYSVHSL